MNDRLSPGRTTEVCDFRDNKAAVANADVHGLLTQVGGA